MLNNVQDRLFNASACGHLKDVEQAFLEGANLVQQDAWGKTALHAAAEGGHLAMVQWLVVKGGVDQNQKDNYGETALHCAAYEGHLGVVKWLVMLMGLEAVELYSAGVLHAAAEEGHIEVVQWLVVELGVNLNQVDAYGNTALSCSINEDYLEVTDYLEVARYLLSHGADEVSAEKIACWGAECQAAYQSVLQDRVVQEKRAVALAFPGNLMVHRAIDQQTHQNFDIFYRHWKMEMSWGLKPIFKQTCWLDVTQQEAYSKKLFKEHCHLIAKLMNSSKTKKTKTQEQFVFFSLGSHIRAGEVSVVRTLPDDVLRMIGGWLCTEHPEGIHIFQCYRNALNKAALDINFNIAVQPIPAPEHSATDESRPRM